MAANLHVIPQSPKSDKTLLVALSDDALMQRVTQDEKAAFGVIVERHHRAVLGFATRFFGNVSAGEEVAQDVFLSLWAERHRYQSKGKLLSFLLSMAFHRACIVARTERNLTKRQDAAAQLATPHEHASQLESVVHHRSMLEVRGRLAALPPDVRQVLILRYLNDLPLDEIEGITGLPLGTIKSHLSRGLKRLRTALSGETP